MANNQADINEIWLLAYIMECNIDTGFLWLEGEPLSESIIPSIQPEQENSHELHKMSKSLKIPHERELLAK